VWQFVLKYIYFEFENFGIKIFKIKNLVEFTQFKRKKKNKTCKGLSFNLEGSFFNCFALFWKLESGPC
jgi:hypothetical protein